MTSPSNEDRSQHGSEVLAGFVSEASQVKSIDELFACSARWLRRLVPSERASVALPDDQPGSLRVVAMEGNQAIPTKTRLPIEGTAVGRCFSKGMISGTDEAAGGEELDVRALYLHGLRSSRCIPLFAEGQVYGALNVARTVPYGFSTEDEDVLKGIAAIVAGQLAIHQRIDTALDEVSALQDANRRTTALNELGAQLAILQDEGEILDLVARTTPELFGTQRASLALVQPGGESAILLALSGPEAQVGQGHVMNIATSSIGHCIREKRLLHFPDLSVADYPESKKLYEIGLRSGLNVPLLCGQEVVGTLNMGRQALGPFSPTDLFLAEQLARLVAHSLVGVRTQAAMRQAKAEAQEMARAKGAFLANVSHELRTPLNGVIGISELLSETPLDAEQTELVEALRSSGALLRRLIDDVLTFSKLDAGKLSIEDSSFDLVAAIESSLELVRGPCAQKGLQLSATIDPETPTLVSGDETRLKQVLANLLSNAAKFTSHGEVELVAACEPKGPDGLELHISVRDTGKGILPEARHAVFQPFQQEDDSITRRFGGTGLGLAICRELCRGMGGDIELESEAGKGSCFRFHVDLRPVREQPEAIDLGSPAVGLCSPHPSFRRSLQARLTALGCRVHELDPEVPLPDQLDIVLADLEYQELAETWIRTSDGQAAAPRLIAMAAVREPNATCPQAPFELVLPRGASTSRLRSALRANTSPSPVPESDRSDSGPKPPTGLRVLLVDDNPINRLVGQKLLTNSGHAPQLASSGAEALQLLKSEPFDVVLLDLQMPEMDGFQTFGALRAGATQAVPPVIALTADAREETRRRCLDLGMLDYLEKPIRAELLTEVLLRLQDARDAA